MGDDKKIFDKIEEMYNLKDEDGKQKNKGFFTHLIKAYLPKKSVAVAVKEPESKKVRVRCVFSQKNLITAEKLIAESQSDSFKKNLDTFIKSFDVDKGCFTSVTPMEQLLNGRTLALTGKDTKTFLSQEAYLAFINWVMTKFLEGDAHIKWLLNGMTNNPFSKPKKKKPQVYSTPGFKKSTMGDMSALQALKEKMEKDDNNN